jgi:hypothetical protein
MSSLLLAGSLLGQRCKDNNKLFFLQVQFSQLTFCLVCVMAAIDKNGWAACSQMCPADGYSSTYSFRSACTLEIPWTLLQLLVGVGRCLHLGVCVVLQCTAAWCIEEFSGLGEGISGWGAIACLMCEWCVAAAVLLFAVLPVARQHLELWAGHLHC